MSFATLSALLTDFNPVSVAFRILLAAIVGGCIGSERGRHGRAAGLRTHILVCLGATMTALVGLYSASSLGFSSDPMRLGAQVISGIGFLGAGTILTRNRSQVTGLTTAAGLWTTASLGLAIGVGFYGAVAAAFVVVLFTISVLTRLERSVKRRDLEPYYLELNDVAKVNDLFAQFSAELLDLQVIPAKSGTPGHVGLTCELLDTGSAEQTLARIQDLDYVVITVPLAQ